MADRDRLRRLRRRRAIVGAVVVILCLWIYCPVLHVGYLADDLYQIALVEGLFGPHAPWDLYTFADGDAATNAEQAARGTLPWWTASQFRYSMLRPLASLLVSIDHWLFPRDAVVHHVHGLLWLFACLWIAHRMLVRHVGDRVALLAVVSFAIDETNVWMVAWIANRCTLVSLLFALLALHRHHRARAAGRGLRAQGVELLLWVLAFAGGEYAVGGIAYLFAYEIAMGTGGTRARLVALVPGFAVALVYAVVYVLGDHGVYGATMYIDPVHDLGAFFGSAGERIGRMAGEVWTQMAGEAEIFRIRYGHTGLVDRVMPPDGSDVVTQAWRHARFAVLTSVALVSVAWLFARRCWTDTERRVARWMVLGSTLSLVPIAAIPPASRALMFANFGAAVFMALVVAAAGRAWRRRSVASDARSWVFRGVVTAAALGLVYLHLLREAVYAAQKVNAFVAVKSKYDGFYGASEFSRIDLDDKHVLVVAAPGLVTGIHGLSVLRLMKEKRPHSWHVLAMGPRPYLVRGIDDRSFELSSVGGAMQTGPQEILFRARADALGVGDVVDVGLFEARVTHAHEGVGPTAIVFTLDRSLQDASVVWLEVGPEGLRRFAHPPPGKTVVIKPPALPEAHSR
jgi:hypothetical protein